VGCESVASSISGSISERDIRSEVAMVMIFGESWGSWRVVEMWTNSTFTAWHRDILVYISGIGKAFPASEQISLNSGIVTILFEPNTGEVFPACRVGVQFQHLIIHISRMTLIVPDFRM
jgi:hypothetical protein